ncbi:MAG: efflux RND transporter periplasmic adaptor subunit [Proteobacteria bacterium]|nr:efflux RND transporter periplasmic adaptor subunit [Pseudomonadota bacterium]
MKRFISIALLLIIGLAAGVILDRYLPTNTDETAMEHAEKHTDPNYICPMHSEIVSNEQGSCPICGMDLVEIKTSESNIDDSDDPYPTVRVSSTMINNMGVRVALVERKTLIRQIETPGFIKQVRKESYTRYNSPAKGRVAKFHFKQGQWFEQGDSLIDIELDDLVLVQEKHLELLTKQTEQKKNKEEKPNEEPLTESTEVVTDAATTNKVVTEKKSAEPTIEKTRLLMKAAGMTEEQITDLEETKVTSPVITLYAKHAGEVEKLRVTVGEEVKANTLLFALGGLMRVTVLANAFQRDASWVKPGQDVDIILPHDSNKPLKGKVSSGAVSININSQNIGVELVFNAPHSVVKNGMYVVGNIYGQVQKDTLTLPREAIIYSRNEKRVIVALGKGRFKPVAVETGISNDNEVEILKGLEHGDTVVVSAQFLIDSESSLQASYRRMTAVE